MRKVVLFMMVSLDGYFEGENHDLSWHNVDEEFNEYAVRNLDTADTLLFGRKTYQLMESFWPTTQGLEDDPTVAEKMNTMAKIVFSHSLDKVTQTEHWKNVVLIKDNIAGGIMKLKALPGKDMLVLGSSNLCVSLLEHGLLDELRIMINPVVIGKGTPLFEGIKKVQKFTLISSRNFTSGNVLLTYQV
ncbi:MAG TPA: dihydrofolate reductase family protein [Candidatus Saccharimonadales bacterium]|nr:dihydrofolate reductase family protein [Candidatus Saccharimonadales bacterium]